MLACILKINFLIFLSIMVMARNDSQRRILAPWGNGNIQPSLGEECDDGNNIDGDGCSSTCIIEAGWTWVGNPSVCFKWGDGVFQTGEQWDDGNTLNSDGWSSTCTIESGYTWTTASPSVWTLLWGNGVINTGETFLRKSHTLLPRKGVDFQFF